MCSSDLAVVNSCVAVIIVLITEKTLRIFHSIIFIALQIVYKIVEVPVYAYKHANIRACKCAQEWL